MQSHNIKWLHVELSSKCNAWCPACPRNKNGYGLADGLVEQDLSIERLQQVIDQLPGLTAVQLCGNLGDPMAAHNIVEVIDLIKAQGFKIQIHTNGGLRNQQWWKNLGQQLAGTDHEIWFGIDGLQGIHEIYRQGTTYDKVIGNAKSFIENGGRAIWQFIPYAHNEHQIRDCMRESQRLNFAGFKLVKLYRNKQLAKHYQTGAEFDLLPPTLVESLVQMPNDRKTVNPQDCMHLNIPSIYLNASGQLSKCCYFGSTKTFDTVEELLYNKLNLEHVICLKNCGS